MGMLLTPWYTHAGTTAKISIVLFNKSKNMTCVMYSVLSYISGLCTAVVEQQELHEDNVFTLNSEILQ